MTAMMVRIFGWECACTTDLMFIYLQERWRDRELKSLGPAKSEVTEMN
jgi:hypothetical protein